MAPEQCRDEPAAAVADLFALGATLFEALTGERAFHARRLGAEWLYPQLTGVLPRALPGALGALVTRLLRPEPGNRPAGAAAVLRELDGAMPVGTAPLWPDWLEFDDFA
jgi:hypothetical protein